MATENPGKDDRVRQLVHDLQHCLHVIGMGMELLRDARGDEAQFAEICETIDHERTQAAELIRELAAEAHSGKSGGNPEPE